MERHHDGSVTLTRDELFDQVWTTPVRHLAKEYGLSDVGLAKICRKHHIPRPPVGYWAKLEHGKKVKRPRLPKLNDPRLERIRIRPQRQATEVKDEQAQRRVEEEHLAHRRIVVPDQLEDPHPVVVRTEKSLRSARVEDDGLVRPRAKKAFPLAVTPQSIDRAMRITDTLLKALEERGHSLQVGSSEEDSRTATIQIEGEDIRFCLVEDVDRQERELTANEERERLRSPWLHRGPVYTFHPTGRLALHILTHGRDGLRRRWGDGKTQQLEDLLNNFVVALIKTADAARETRRKQEELRRRREAWEKERHEKLELIRREEKAIENLHAEVNAWHKAERVRAYVRVVHETALRVHGEIAEDSECGRWLRWASAQADRMDPLTESPPSILDQKPKYEHGLGYPMFTR